MAISLLEAGLFLSAPRASAKSQRLGSRSGIIKVENQLGTPRSAARSDTIVRPKARKGFACVCARVCVCVSPLQFQLFISLLIKVKTLESR